jgi:hypothetical protein
LVTRTEGAAVPFGWIGLDQGLSMLGGEGAGLLSYIVKEGKQGRDTRLDRNQTFIELISWFNGLLSATACGFSAIHWVIRSLIASRLVIRCLVIELLVALLSPCSCSWPFRCHFGLYQISEFQAAW